ncbi:MarR family winged helix-turn-helix transcriptional regulator [Acrocarpospora catenulata]|uniref:MarR family winged helix-turn-helix transcriptional regulator n=1 Tax=Acrocarpospora catenulata TaxID=2836182 RepID=UPI0027E087A3|nr:MarR family transcriptional regulator [Acrocarpospora catenulata]
MSDQTGERPGTSPGAGTSAGNNQAGNDTAERRNPGGTTEDSERTLLIDRLAESQRGLGRFLARDRSMPLLATTLTMQQLKVVMSLSFLGSASGQDLARELGIGLATMTGIVDRVVARGLASRREDPTDRRVRRVELTPAGRDLAAQILDAGASTWRDLLAHLDLETLRDLERVMGRLTELMADLHAKDHTPCAP